MQARPILLQAPPSPRNVVITSAWALLLIARRMQQRSNGPVAGMSIRDPGRLMAGGRRLSPAKSDRALRQTSQSECSFSVSSRSCSVRVWLIVRRIHFANLRSDESAFRQNYPLDGVGAGALRQFSTTEVGCLGKDNCRQDGLGSLSSHRQRQALRFSSIFYKFPDKVQATLYESLIIWHIQYFIVLTVQKSYG